MFLKKKKNSNNPKCLFMKTNKPVWSVIGHSVYGKLIYYYFVVNLACHLSLFFLRFTFPCQICKPLYF